MTGLLRKMGLSRASLGRYGRACLAAWLVAALCPTADAAGGRVRARIPGPVPVIVEALHISMLPSGLVRATGDVQVTRGEDSLTAHEATYDPATDEIEAVGDAVLVQPERRLTGDRLRYSAQTGKLLGTDVRAALASKVPDVEYRFRGESLSGTPEEYRIQGGLFTTCEKDPPHFGLRAREITYRPGDRVKARHVSLIFFGKPILTLPGYTFDLSRDRDKSDLFPQLSLGRTDGVGLRSDLKVRLPYGAVADTYAVLSARHIIRGGVGIGSIGSIPLGIRAGFKEDAPNRYVSGLTVTVLPAITFHLPEITSPSESLQLGLCRYRPTFETIASDITGGDWSGTQRYRFVAGGSAGRYLEHPTGAAANRLNFTGALEFRPFQALPNVEVGAALRGRIGYYSPGTRYGVVSPEVCVRWRPSERDFLRAEFRHQIARGTTPFLFDRIDATRNLSFTWRNRTAERAIEMNADIDLDHWSLYNWSVGYSRRMECLQPGLIVHRRGKDWGIGLTLEVPGLTGGF